MRRTKTSGSERDLHSRSGLQAHVCECVWGRARKGDGVGGLFAALRARDGGGCRASTFAGLLGWVRLIIRLGTSRKHGMTWFNFSGHLGVRIWE